MTHPETTQEQYRRLIWMLKNGWSVEPPVYARPTWETRHEAHVTYHFVLRRGRDVMLISVQDDPAVTDLMRDSGWESNWLGEEPTVWLHQESVA